jgi:hypothetical protein
MHELSLSAGLCDWDGDYPYAWARSRVTPEFVAVLAAHVRASGDLLLARELWPAALRALEWCRGTLDEKGRMQRSSAGIALFEPDAFAGRIGHEAYLQGLWISALSEAAELARDCSLDTRSMDLEAMESAARAGFESFWSEETQVYAFALLADGELPAEASALAGLALSRGIGEATRAAAAAAHLARRELCADWGARLFALKGEDVDDPSGDSRGEYRGDSKSTVFPHLTAGVALALHHHGYAASALQLVEAQAALCGFGGAGLIPEQFDGREARTARRGSPHRVASSAAFARMVLHGLFGLHPRTRASVLELRPALPPGCEQARLEGLRIGAARIDLKLARERAEGRTLLRAVFTTKEASKLALLWRPRCPPLSRPAANARVQGESVPIELVRLPSGAIEVRLPEVVLDERVELELELEEGPQVRIPGDEIERGAESRQPRLVQTEVRDESLLIWRFAGPAGSTLRLPFTSDREVAVSGAAFKKGELVLEFPRPTGNPPSEWSEAVVELRLPAH